MFLHVALHALGEELALASGSGLLCLFSNGVLAASCVLAASVLGSVLVEDSEFVDLLCPLLVLLSKTHVNLKRVSLLTFSVRSNLAHRFISNGLVQNKLGYEVDRLIIWTS